MTISAGNCTVRGLNIVSFASSGIELDTNGGNTIENNNIGTDNVGTIGIGNQFGVTVQNGSSSNVIGGTSAPSNVIDYNTVAGVLIQDSGTTNNTVEGNTLAFNGDDGVLIFNGPSSNTVGGALVGSGNMLGNNGRAGVTLFGVGTSFNSVQGNDIGTDGTNAEANAMWGVFIGGGATSNTVGGFGTSSGNIISGNGVAGVYITDPNTSQNVVLNNTIGLNSAGNVLANGDDGVLVFNGASSNIIGRREEATPFPATPEPASPFSAPASRATRSRTT